MAEFQLFPGYSREEETTEELVAAIRQALTTHPTQRLGQMLTNALGLRDPVGSRRSLDQLEHKLWNIHDETVIQILKGYAK